MKTKRELVILAAAFLAAAVLAGCAGGPSPERAAQTVTPASTLIRTEPAQRPDWVDRPTTVSATTLGFTGTSGRYARATGVGGARYYAEEFGRIQFGEYYGALMANQARTYVAINGLTSDVLDPQLIGQQLLERMSQNVVQSLLPVSYFTEVYLESNTRRESYEVYVLLEVDKAVMTKAVNDYAREQADDYARRVAAEQDQVKRQQLEAAAEFFGGNLSSNLGL